MPPTFLQLVETFVTNHPIGAAFDALLIVLVMFLIGFLPFFVRHGLFNKKARTPEYYLFFFQSAAFLFAMYSLFHIQWNLARLERAYPGDSEVKHSSSEIRNASSYNERRQGP